MKLRQTWLVLSACQGHQRKTHRCRKLELKLPAFFEWKGCDEKLFPYLIMREVAELLKIFNCFYGNFINYGCISSVSYVTYRFHIVDEG